MTETEENEMSAADLMTETEETEESEEELIPCGIKHIFPGSPLLEVISISVTPNDYPCQLSGGIWVVDDKGSVRIFNVDPGNPVTIDRSNPSPSLSLLNRNRAIIADDDDLFVYFELKNMNGNAELNGYYSLSRKHRNTLMVEKIEEKLGSVSVTYFVHWAAVEADIWATLDGTKVPRNLNASLKVAASYVMYDIAHNNRERRCEVTIFKGKVIHDDKDEKIHLNGCVLALPTYSNVTIDICLQSSADDTKLWGEKVTFDILEISFFNRCKKNAGTEICPIELRAVTFDYSPNPVGMIYKLKGYLCPKWVFVYEEEEDDDDDDDDDEEEDRKRKRSQQEQNKVTESNDC